MVTCGCFAEPGSVQRGVGIQKRIDLSLPELPRGGSIDTLLGKLEEALPRIEILSDQAQTVGFRLTPRSYDNLCAELPSDRDSNVLYERTKERLRGGDLIVMGVGLSSPDQPKTDEQSQPYFKVEFDLYRQPRAA